MPVSGGSNLYLEHGVEHVTRAGLLDLIASKHCVLVQIRYLSQSGTTGLVSVIVGLSMSGRGNIVVSWFRRASFLFFLPNT